MKTECGKPYRVLCTDRKHPDGRRFLVAIDRGDCEICLTFKSLNEVSVISQWFDKPITLLLEG